MSGSSLFGVLLKYIKTEKASNVLQFSCLVFEVRKSANKRQIRESFEMLFGVNKVLRVNVCIIPGKSKIYKNKEGRRPSIKKAYITLRHGEDVELPEVLCD